MKRGKLIVIEGTDGTGKKTQTGLLVERLRRDGRCIFTTSFPQYGQKSAGLVENYLAGVYGEADKLDPKIASVFYAVDRFDAARRINAALDQGHDVILDRYVDSNAGHQGGKIADEMDRQSFLHWLYDFEYEVLKVPRPDLVVLLYAPIEVTLKLMAGRKRGKDGHEADSLHLARAADSYLWLAGQYPDDHAVIQCAPEGEILAPEVIQERIYGIVKPLLQ